MKFTWFNLMPWPYLPDDFRGKNRSVWVDIDSKLFDPVKSHEVYNTYMDLLEYAGTLGFDGIGVNEHHQNGYGIMPSPNIIAAGLARRTKDVGLVVLGNSIALYNPPVRVAEEFAMLDCISGGRLVAGFPVGTSMDTNYCYGQIPALTREKYAEAHDLIRRAGARRSRLRSTAATTSLRHVNIWPRADSESDAGAYSRRRFCRDLRLLYRQHLFVFVPVVQRLHPRQGADGWLLESASRNAMRRIRRPIARALRRRFWWPIPTKKQSGSIRSTFRISTTAACMCSRALPMRRGIARSRRSRPARCRNTRR
ncbi:MAG: LLM class flavin-dependent oxidoreductase [Rhizomicrobium sp.]